MSLTAGLQALNTWLAAHPHLGLFAYSGLFVVLFMAFVPTTPMELLAGYAFGFWPAIALLTALKPFSYVLTLVTMRRLGMKDAGAALKGRLKAFRAVGLAIEADAAAEQRIVFLVCLAYLPAAVKVCGLAAVPSVRVRTVLGCATLGGIPFSVVSTWLGSSADDLQDLLSGTGPVDPWQRAVKLSAMVLGTGALIGCLAAIGWYGKRALESLPEGDASLLQDEPSEGSTAAPAAAADGGASQQCGPSGRSGR